MLCWLLLFTLVKLITITTALPNLDVSPSEGDLADRGEIAGILLRENKLKKEKSYLTIIANEYKDDELVRQSVCIATHYDPTGAKVSTANCKELPPHVKLIEGPYSALTYDRLAMEVYAPRYGYGELLEKTMVASVSTTESSLNDFVLTIQTNNNTVASIGRFTEDDWRLARDEMYSNTWLWEPPTPESGRILPYACYDEPQPRRSE